MWSESHGQYAEAEQDLSAGTLTLNLLDSKVDNFVHSVGIGFDGSVSQTVVLTLTSPSGAAYVQQLDSSVLSSATKYTFRGDPIFVPAGWTLGLTCTASGAPAVTASASMIYQRR